MMASGMNGPQRMRRDRCPRHPQPADSCTVCARERQRAWELARSGGHVADLFPEVAANVTGAMANDRYTTAPTLAWCKRVLGVEAFDLDVAACEEAHHAPNWHGHHAGDVDRLSQFTDGLRQPWMPILPRELWAAWCNPPYDDLLPWVVKAWNTAVAAIALRQAFVLGMLIPDNRREQPFWQRLVEPFRDGRHGRPHGRHPNAQGDAGPVVHLVHAAADAQVFLDHPGAEFWTHSLPGRQPFGVPGNPEGVGQASPPFGVVLLEWRWAP